MIIYVTGEQLLDVFTLFLIKLTVDAKSNQEIRFVFVYLIDFHMLNYQVG